MSNKAQLRVEPAAYSPSSRLLGLVFAVVYKSIRNRHEAGGRRRRREEEVPHWWGPTATVPAWISFTEMKVGRRVRRLSVCVCVHASCPSITRRLQAGLELGLRAAEWFQLPGNSRHGQPVLSDIGGQQRCKQRK